MSNDFKYGDIFYVRNGHWCGLYIHRNEPKIIIYNDEDLNRVIKLKDFKPLKYGRKTIEVREDTFETKDIIILGNVFELAKEALEEAKIKYEEAVETCSNLEDFISVKDKRFLLDMELGGEEI